MSTRVFLLFSTREVGKSSKRERRRTPKLRGHRPGVPTSSRQTPGFPPAGTPSCKGDPPAAPGRACSRNPAAPLPKGSRRARRCWGAAGLRRGAERPLLFQHPEQLRPARPDGAAAPAARARPGLRSSGEGREGMCGDGRGRAGGRGDPLRRRGRRWGWSGFEVPRGCGEPGAGRRFETRRACPGTMTRREGGVGEEGLG